MSLETPDKIGNLQRKLYGKAKAEPAYRFYRLYARSFDRTFSNMLMRSPVKTTGRQALTG